MRGEKIFDTIHGRSYGVAVHEKAPDTKHSAILTFDSQNKAEKFENQLNKAFYKGEKKASDDDVDDPGPPNDDDPFQVTRKIGKKQYAVVFDGRQVGEYETEREANIVAASLNKKTKKAEKKAKGVMDEIDPETGLPAPGGPLDPLN